MNIFISHAHEDKPLAKAWQELLRWISNGEIDPWYSSDDRVEGGVGTGEWRTKVQAKIENAEILLIIFTPGSNERPWLLWESGFAAGKSKVIIPIRFFISDEAVHSVFESLEKFDGETEENVLNLCERILNMATGAVIPNETKEMWKILSAKYLKLVQNEKTVSFSKRLFHKHFHQTKIAEDLTGEWYARWTKLNDDNSEVIWETDKLHIWSAENRIRMVGFSSKKGVKEIENSQFYPMEGVVSKTGWIAMSYWSGGTIPICGTCLLKPRGLTGDVLVGNWQGYTSLDLSEEATYTRGRVIFSRRLEVVENYLVGDPT